ncbi:MAG: hypothetical protein BGO77_01015 [Caedibacter sp. 37-49]|nr:MAG: hypothetical protein BGO77_01015 [Caedibacter sp. 37-49]
MSFNWIAKVSACLVLSCFILTNSIKASSILEEQNSLQKFIVAFDTTDSNKKAPSLRALSDFQTWKKVFEEAYCEAEKKYNYLEILRKNDSASYFKTLKSSFDHFLQTHKFLLQTNSKELDIITEPKALQHFTEAAKALISIEVVHEDTSTYIFEKHKDLIQSYSVFTKYEENDQLKELKNLVESLSHSLAVFSANPKDMENLLKIAQDLLSSEETLAKLQHIKLLKRKDSSPARVSPSNSKESPKSKKREEEKPSKHRERSKTLESIFSSKKKIDPKKEVFKQLAVKAQEKAMELQDKNNKDETPAN